MQFFKRLSIQDKLKSVFILNTLCALLFIVVTFGVYHWVDDESDFIKMLSLNSEALGINASKILAENDIESGEKILQAFSSKLDISSIIILDNENKIFSAYYNNEKIKKKLSKINWQSADSIEQHLHHNSEKPEITKYGFHSKQIIFYDGNVVGSLHVFMNHQPFLKYVYEYLLLCSIFLLVSSILTLFISSRIQRVFTTPIIELKNSIKKITSSKDYSVKVPVLQQDELGELSAEFNKMIGEIDDREKRIVADQHKLEEEVIKRTKELCIANEQLSQMIKKAEFEREKAEQASYTKSMFVANMSHEIRTPLNGLLGMMEILRKTNLNNDQAEYLQIAQSSADTLLHIINDILDFSKIEADQLVLESAPFNLRSIVEQVCIQFAERAHSKGIELILDIPPDLHSAYLGDELRIKQVLLNLISNSIKFTEVGSITVSLEAIDFKPNKDCVIKVTVADTGCGIDSDEPGKIFEPFIQADDSTSRKYGGTGLGLSICKKLIELMDGTIDVSTQLHRGTKFFFTIKLPYLEQVNSISRQKVSFDALHALIVDDVEVNCKILASQLNAWQINCEYVTGGEAALARLQKSCDRKFDLLITDFHMPNINGLELCKKIRESNDYQPVEIILLSSLSVQVPKDEASLLQIKAHLNKPIKQHQLFQAITQIFNKTNNEMCLYSESDEMTTNQSFFGKRILVAEDNTVNQGLARIILEDLGCEVSICNNGKEAFEKFKQEKFDIIFMDCQMPLVDGYEATKKIRTFEGNLRQYTPIIALTANVTKEDKEKCKFYGMDDYISKPYSEKDIYQTLSKWFNHQPNPKQPEPKHPIENGQNLSLEKMLSNSPESSILIDLAIITKLRSLDKPNKPSTLRKLINLYIESMDNKLNEMDKSLKSNNLLEVHQTAHMLKSSSASIGATTIAEKFKDIETHSKKEDLMASCALFEKLKNDYEKARPMFESIMKDLPL